ncbi:TauD/TfdA family dioxygenase [Blastopirellula retiformator]|nr:TauD/TfdA family dioxygenase [Blastopirellula retiformator]
MKKNVNQSLASPDAFRRRPSQAEPTEHHYQECDSQGFVFVVESTFPGGLEWFASNRNWIHAKLKEHGAIIFRGFTNQAASEFHDWMITVCSRTLKYEGRSSPRTKVFENVYTSTDYPPDRRIPFHNESSYRREFPTFIAFYCARPAEGGGQTGLVRTDQMLGRIPESIRLRFEERKWMYVRNFQPGVGMSWQESFCTDDKAQIEAHCRRESMTFQWLSNVHLQTRAIRDPIIVHPVTGEKCWFNHACFFHRTSLDPDIRAMLEEQLGVEYLPTNSFYGDGGEIDAKTIDQIRQAYLVNSVNIEWQTGDLLLVDNIMTAHCRAPYQGNRLIYAAMA